MAVASNPFEAPRPGARPRWQPVRPGFVAVARFLARRGLLLILAPILLVLSLTVAYVPIRWWMAFIAGAMWLPTTTVILWARFLGRLEDDQPVVLANGNVLDRDRYWLLVRASALDRVLLAGLILPMAASLVLAGGLTVLVAVFVLALAFWLVWIALNTVLVGDALIAFSSEDYESAARKLERVVRWPRMNWPYVDGCRMTLSTCLVRTEDPLGALQVLSRVHRRRRQAHLARAQLLAGQGRVDDARTAMQGREPRTLGERIAWQAANVLLALEEGRPDDAVAQVKTWDALRDELPPTARDQLYLLEAAAHHAAGDTAAARAALKLSGVRPTERGWIAQAFPTWWANLQAVAAATV